MVNYFSVLFVFTLLCSGCSLKEIIKQTNAIENVGFIKGKVSVASSQRESVVVVMFKERNGVLTLVSQTIASSKGDYQFTVLPGNYSLAAFIDANNDGQYQPEEHGNYHIEHLMMKVEAGETIEVKPIHIVSKPLKLPADIKTDIDIYPFIKNIGTVVSLSDPTFERANYSMGMWKPLDFLKQVGGGLFFLQEYRQDKIPILFVHGVKGGPRDWEAVLNRCDRQVFQPWILYYPSGFRLDTISDYFVYAVVYLQNKHGFEQLNIIAHSMGGLVTRSFMKKYMSKFKDFSKNINLVMTINSPMDGIRSAVSGVKNSPIVLPAWRDVATGSPFLQDIHTWNWPRDIPYHLVFSYKTGKSSDGTVDLKSQIPSKLQSEATRMYGFNNDHVGILSDDDFLGLFDKILMDNIYGSSPN